MSPEEKPPEESASGHPLEPIGESAELDSSESENPSVDASEAQPTDSRDSNFGSAGVTPIETAALADSPNYDPPQSANLVIAEIVESSVEDLSLDDGATLNPTHFSSIPSPKIAGNLENMSANGGAIGSIVLGAWCVAGSFITNWSIINGVIGLLMGFWGLNSRKQRTAWIGIALCIIGIFLSLIQVNELINTYLNAVDENSF